MAQPEVYPCAATGPKTLVLGLGNDILTDDAVGLVVAREVRRRLGARPDVAVDEAEVSGFCLLDIVSGYNRVVIVDAIRTAGGRPGDLYRLAPEDLPMSVRLTAMHEINLPTALALGRRLGLPMPEEIVILGVEVEDDQTFGEGLTPAVAACVGKAADRVLSEVTGE